MDVTRLRAANLADEKRAEIHKEQTVDLTGTLPGSSVPPDPGLSAKSPPSFLLLGPMGITDGNETIVLQPSKPSSLLAALLLHANSVVSASFLQRVVWGESGTTNARSTLHTCVQRLRRLFAKYGLSGNLIDSVSGGYRITADSGTLDLIAFRELLRKASAAPNPEAELLPLQAALTLWRDPVLANVHSDVLHREVLPRLAEERLRAVERVFDIELGLGRWSQIIAGLWPVARAHPPTSACGRSWSRRCTGPVGAPTRCTSTARSSSTSGPSWASIPGRCCSAWSSPCSAATSCRRGRSGRRARCRPVPFRRPAARCCPNWSTRGC